MAMVLVLGDGLLVCENTQGLGKLGKNKDHVRDLPQQD